jgi:CRISPR system Cascade subunit CasE
MYLSCLLIDVGTNPDRPRPGRLWLRNLYRVHQRLCMAFPSETRKDSDSDFLQPYQPEDFECKHVHVARRTNAGFLFRIDAQPGGRVVILVLSALKPDWDYAFHNAGYVLAAPPSEPRPLELAIDVGSRFRFCLTANPVFRVREESVDQRGKHVDAKWVGKRVPVPGDEASLRNWLERRAAPAGFALKELTLIRGGYVYVNRTREAASGQRLRSVRYDGVLEVTDADRFREALIRGVGPAKAFGFGLLSIAPVR